MSVTAVSVVIAAHNEAAVLGRCLDALLSDPAAPALEITVVANGCSDTTTSVAASRHGVRVVDLAEPGKAGALNAGDEVTTTFPRLYLDADIVLPHGSIRALAEALSPEVPAVVPRRALDVSGRPLPVRGYFAINSRLPAYRNALFGRGAIMLSERGRARFGEFPGMVADDLFLDSLFTTGEKREVPAAVSTVATPRRTADLVRRLTRVRAGNAAMRSAAARGEAPSGVRQSVRSSWLRDVVLPRPWLAPAAACYVGLTVLAAVRAKRQGDVAWGHDESSRTEPAAR
ncbi:glycosyltransferase [Actinoplanes sp. NPDC023936]|uniref:glycosyltransferase n=1 Tax=Actinoplanes sp. NPDC023936 TaxID=3154910 RepID=UPI0033FA97EB